MTAQIPEKLIYRNKVLAMTCTPLDGYLEANNINLEKFNNGRCSALWRGYIGTWEIENNQIFLNKIQNLNNENINLQDLIPNKKHFCEWFTGQITYVEGHNLSYFHGGFGGIYEIETHLEIKNGIVESGYKIYREKNPQYIDCSGDMEKYKRLKISQKNPFIETKETLVFNRIIQPPRNQWDKLRQRLEAGELTFIEYLDENLSEGWEIYIQPSFNGLCPDVIILHPIKGICIFEVKNWDFEAVKYTTKLANNGKLHLKAKKTGRSKEYFPENPVDKLLLYRKEMRHLYTPQLGTESGSKILFCGLVFPSATKEQLKENIIPIFENRNRILFSKEMPYAKYFVLTKESLSEKINNSFPAKITRKYNNSNMSPVIADYLRFWLNEPEAPKEQRQPLELDKKQLEYALTRTKTGYRRLKGSAGSGKSLIIAKKACHLLQQGKTVLVATFNITLCNYLTDLAVRDYPRARKEGTWLNFHYLCSRICIEAGYEEEYNHLFENSKNGEFCDDNKLCDLVEDCLKEYACPTYDAILVDEGQDYNPRWWNILRKMLNDGGEMLLVADTTQDIYGTGSLWTEEAMKNCGFSGEWAKLNKTYRLPYSLIPFIRDYANAFIPKNNIILPESPIEEYDMFKKDNLDAGNLSFTWVNELLLTPDILKRHLENFEKAVMQQKLTFADQTILTTTHKIGMDICNVLDSKKIKHTDIFAEDWQEQRRKKQYFFKGSHAIKACTIHSYKGWESKALFIIIDKLEPSHHDAELLYVALTRLKGGSPCAIYILCTESNLIGFGNRWNTYYNKNES